MNQENIESIKIEVDEEKSTGYRFLGTSFERFIFLLLLTLISCGPIIFGKSIPSHADWHIHIEHAYNFKRCLLQGQLLPRWIDAQVNGYGLPIFNYYAPFIYYIYSFLDLIFRDAILSIKWVFVIPMILCTITGYLYLRRHGSPTSSTLATAFIIFSPTIHIFIYNTNWPGSTLAVAFLFLLLYGVDSFDKEKSFDYKSFLIVTTAYTGMILTHLATAFVFTLLSVPYFFLSLNIYRTKRFVKNFILSMTLGGSMAGFYLLPAALEKKFVHTDEVLTAGPLWDYSKNFLFTYLDRNKDEGFAWAIFDHRFYETSNAIYGLAAFVSFLILIANIDAIKKYLNEPKRVANALIMFAITFLMMTPVSVFVWILVKPLQTIQFPWRFTAFVLPFAALIMVYSFDLVGSMGKHKIHTAGYKIIFGIIFVLFSILAYVDFINMYKWKWVPEESILKAAIYVLWGNEEYRPNITGDPRWKEYNFRQDFSPVLQSSDQEALIKIKRWLSHERIIEVFSYKEHLMRFKTFYFPGWEILVDGISTGIRMEQKSNAMIVTIPPGQHEVKLRFVDTPIRKGSKYLSILGFILYAYVFLKAISKNTLFKNLKNIQKSNDKEAVII